MLAVKLHKNKKPFLGRGSFVIPISTWASGRIQVKNWISVLNRHNRGRNDAIRYATLVNIPKKHPVFMGVDWVVKHIRKVEFKALSEIDAEIKRALDLQKEGEDPDFVAQGFVYPDVMVGSPKAELPELILGLPLPKRCIKWSKDIQLLYTGNKKTAG